MALYGGLNFYLANNRWATGGFTRAPLEVPPPLSGGPQRYPAFLIAGLPPPDLAFSYPPHVEIVNHGYRLGREWIFGNPAGFLDLAWRKLGIFWSGVALGFTGYNLPLGMSGIRRAVDLVVPEGGPAVGLWRGGVLVAMLLGLWVGRREEALLPWLFLLATKLTTTVAFFGYAREGAVMIPIFALSVGLLARHGWSFLAREPTRRRAGVTMLCLLASALIAVEAFRWHSQPVILLDGRETGAADPYPGADYEERRLQVRRGPARQAHPGESRQLRVRWGGTADAAKIPEWVVRHFTLTPPVPHQRPRGAHVCWRGRGRMLRSCF